jgi:hypothetical protein
MKGFRAQRSIGPVDASMQRLKPCGDVVDVGDGLTVVRKTRPPPRASVG